MKGDELTPVWGVLTDLTGARFWICCSSSSDCGTTEEPMKIKLTSVYIDDQEQALRCSTDVLGFVTFEAFDQ